MDKILENGVQFEQKLTKSLNKHAPLFSIFIFILIILYLGLAEEGEKTYVYGPPNPPLKLPNK